MPKQAIVRKVADTGKPRQGRPSLRTLFHVTGLPDVQDGDRGRLSEYYPLNRWLQEYSTDSFYRTAPARRTDIKIELKKKLLACTIRDADIIICTIASAAKVNLAPNFHPVVVCIDEDARVSEFKSLILLG